MIRRKRKKKNYKYEGNEKDFIYSTNNQGVRKLVGGIVDISKHKDNKYSKTKFSSQDIKFEIEKNEERIGGIVNRLTEMGTSDKQAYTLIDGFQFPPTKKYLEGFFKEQQHINPEKVFNLLKTRYELIHTNSIL
jgi:hypothetical protein